MAKSNRGGKRPGAGRPKGALNRATIENKANIEQLARAHSDRAIEVLANALDDESATVRIAAANALLDRGFGKPRQAIEATVNGDLGETERLRRAEERFDSLLAGIPVPARAETMPH